MSLHDATESARICGHHRGLAVKWTRQRFAELVHREVVARAGGEVLFTRIWPLVRCTYAPDESSLAAAKAVTQQVVLEAQAPRRISERCEPSRR